MAKGDAAASMLPPGFKWVAYNVEWPVLMIAIIVTLFPITLMCWAAGPLFRRTPKQAATLSATSIGTQSESTQRT